MFERLYGAIQRMFEFRNRIKIHVNQRNFAMSIEFSIFGGGLCYGDIVVAILLSLVLCQSS